MKRLLLLGLMGLVCCGGARPIIDVTVESALMIPSEADAIELTLLPLESDVAAEAHTTALDAAKPFPLHVVLQPGDDVPHPVRVHVVATLAGAPVADGEAATALDGDVNPLTVTLSK